MDPHDVLDLPREGFTFDQLRYNYKVLARQLHPDKRRVSESKATELFQILTDAYRKLSALLENRVADRTFHELRDAARRSVSSGTASDASEPSYSKASNASQASKASQASQRGFNIDKFNRVFDDNRMSDPVVDGGYERWMKENDPELACAAAGEEPPNRQLKRYVEPEPVVVSNRATVAYSEIGATGVNDYSRPDAAKHAIQYTDYRVAYTTTKLASESDIRAAEERAKRELKSIDALQKHRAKIAYTMNDADAAMDEARSRALEESERRRLDAVVAYDRMLDRFHQKTSHLLR